MKIPRIGPAFAVLAFAFTASLAPVRADEVEDSIKDALASYGRKDYVAAKQSLDYASQLIAQMNAGRLAEILPKPLPGWTAEEVESQAGAMAMFGGGIQAARAYTKGDARIQVTVVGDSPLLGQFMPVFSNPAIAGAMGKMSRIGKQMVLETNDGKLVMVVANRFLVTVEGSESAQDRMAYAKAMDLGALSAL